jgi:TolA-binding protein
MPDFGLPPRRAVLTWRGEHDDRPQVDELDGNDDGGSYASGQELSWEKEELRRIEIERKRGILVKTVNADIDAGQWHHARRAIEQLCDRVGWIGELRDRDQVLQQLEVASQAPAPVLLVALHGDRPSTSAHPSSALLHLYLSALDGHIKDPQSAFQRISNDPHSGFLAEHALYQLASLQAKQGDQAHAIELYWQLLRRFPHTIKRQDALVMIARSALLRPNAEDLRLADGRAALDRLRREFPYTRFHRDLIGLQGRLYFLSKDWKRAVRCYFADDDLASVELALKSMPPAQRGPVRVRLLAAYMRALTSTQSYDRFGHILTDLEHTREAMTVTEADQFGRLLLQQPDTAASYLYYRLYHTAEAEPGVIWPEHDRHSLMVLADRLAARYPAARLSVPVQVRLAEVYYRDHSYRKALAWANRALQPALSDRALYVRAASLRKLGQNVAAQAGFERLLRRFPGSPLRHAVWENLALFYEARHQLGRALDLYFALDYKPDIAYLLDVRMTPAQIASYLDHHSRSPYRNLVAYSLGIRYLRAEKWREARRMLSSVPHKTYLKFANPQDRDGGGLATDPLRAVADLERLHRTVQTARTARTKASALYWYAHYYATHDELLLYNMALWNGEREFNFEIYWNDHFATPEDRAAVHQHMFEHETFARSRRICLDLLRRYPHSPTVPYALYRVAVDDLHLATFNRWWEEKQPIKFLKEMKRFKARLARDYPHHPVTRKLLARARLHPDEQTPLWRPQGVAQRVGAADHVANRDYKLFPERVETAYLGPQKMLTR